MCIFFLVLFSVVQLIFLAFAAPSPNKDLIPRAAPSWKGAIPPIKPIGKQYQGTITGYGKGSCNDPRKIGKCGFLGSGTYPQAAFSAGFNEPPQPGQCGTCWQLTAPKRLCYTPNAPPKICPAPNNVDPVAQSGLIVLVTNTCAPDLNPNDGNTIRQCNQKDGSKDGLGSHTVVDLCMDTDAAKAWWGETQRAGLNVATIQQVDCSSWPGKMGPQASWLHGGYKGGPGFLPPAPPSKTRVQQQVVAAPLLADGGPLVVQDETLTS